MRSTRRIPTRPISTAIVQPTFGSITGPDGSKLYYRMLSPPLEPGKRYPVFFYVYGGPHGQQVTDAWYGALPLHEALVDQGWIVFTIDNRGTNRRGTKFENAVYRVDGRCRGRRTSWRASNGSRSSRSSIRPRSR